MTATDVSVAGDLIVESHVGPRPGVAGELLGPVVDALGVHGFATPAESAAAVSAKLSRPSTLLDEQEIAGATKFINSAFAQFQDGAFKNALRDAGPGMATLAKGPATLIRVPEVREVKLRGLIATTLAHSRLGNASEAKRTAGEIIRSFSDKPIDTAIYSPEVVELVSAARSELLREGSATLTVETDVPGTVIYINEVYAGVDRIVKTDLAPGEYRVVLESGDKLGRVHRVALAAGEKRVVPISWALDSVLHTDGDRVVLRFRNEVDRSAREGEFALVLAREVGAKRVAVLGIRQVNGQQRVIGTLYAATRKTPDGAWLAAEPTLPRREALTALGNYLGGDRSGAALIEKLDPGAIGRPNLPKRDRDVTRGGSSRALGWITLAVGAAAIAGGTALVLIHEDEFDDSGDRNPNPRATRVPGIITLSAGAVITGVGVVLLLRSSGSGEQQARAGLELDLAPTDGGLAVGLSGRFLSEKLADDLFDERRRRDALVLLHDRTDDSASHLRRICSELSNRFGHSVAYLGFTHLLWEISLEHAELEIELRD